MKKIKKVLKIINITYRKKLKKVLKIINITYRKKLKKVKNIIKKIIKKINFLNFTKIKNLNYFP